MLTDNNQVQLARPASAASRLAVALVAGAAGAGMGFVAGAWSSQNSVENQCSTVGTATAGESVFDCSNIRRRTSSFR